MIVGPADEVGSGQSVLLEYGFNDGDAQTRSRGDANGTVELRERLLDEFILHRISNGLLLKHHAPIGTGREGDTRGGGDGAQMQVTVGESVPGYGKVTSIAQKGTGWVVTTEHGVIQ